ncbi:general odorant-binding protein 56d-like [Wyeomyia smithii]|uniref:general odorant-binding protein 56d-like n=1 Tax=Wyeomyia smithii TaxID=174621 RepID=UPI002467F335|nr:general odorant-binding protein 56d-like [Wyeomyia smithii]
MKYLALLTLLVVSGYAFFTPEQHEIVKKLSIRCMEEIGEGLPENIGERFRGGDLTLNDAKSKCYMKCIFTKVGFISDTGDVNREVLVEKLSIGNTRERAEMFAERCSEFDGADACEISYGLYQCYHMNRDTFFS